MSTITKTENNAAVTAAQANESTQKKTRVQGKTIGNPELSEKASKYYEELKKKYSNMDFILVSTEEKERAQAQAGNYANPNKTVVLIDEEKIEKMAEDAKYRKQYEDVIKNAASGLAQMKATITKSNPSVKAFGIKVNDGGMTSFFAVIDKSLAKQRERIKEKAEEKRAEEKKAAKEEKAEKDSTVTVTANSIEELMSKINDAMYSIFGDSVQTEEEKQVGQKIDFRL